MAYPYIKQTWANDAAGGTPLNATRLNFIETGIEDLSNEIEAVHDEIDGLGGGGGGGISSLGFLKANNFSIANTASFGVSETFVDWNGADCDFEGTDIELAPDVANYIFRFTTAGWYTIAAEANFVSHTPSGTSRFFNLTVIETGTLVSSTVAVTWIPGDGAASPPLVHHAARLCHFAAPGALGGITLGQNTGGAKNASVRVNIVKLM